MNEVYENKIEPKSEKVNLKDIKILQEKQKLIDRITQLKSNEQFLTQCKKYADKNKNLD